MIKYTEWGKHVRLGNFLYLWAGINSIAKQSGHEIQLPSYFLWDYLENPPTITQDNSYDELFHFRKFNYSIEEKEWIVNYFKERKDKVININLGPHLQSEKFFLEDLDYVKSKLLLKEDKVDAVRKKYFNFFDKKTIGIGIRRGDFVGSGCFYQIPLDWYLSALKAEFSDWKDCNIIFFSDNIEEVKKLFKGDNFFFADANGTHSHANGFKDYHKDPMEQFILGTLCDNFIMGNSTFSWWQSWYIKNFKGGKIVHSGKNLRGQCEKDFYNPDFYPESWVLHEIK